MRTHILPEASHRRGPDVAARKKPVGGVVARIVLLSMVLALAACAEESDPVGMVRSARLAPDTGKTVETALSAYNLFKDPVWETYVDADGRTVVRFVAEYDVSRGVADCPPVGPEVRPAARVFVTLRYLLEGGVVSLADGFIEAYSTTGYSARYLAEPGTVDRIYAGKPCVGCMVLYLPASL